ncbi:hypothetical protein HanIR_Chr15g0759411 [Helianthus annuus]|nr:hypothetical protein HanIR_Chr15g0759411 [Helianthus annuus]
MINNRIFIPYNQMLLASITSSEIRAVDQRLPGFADRSESNQRFRRKPLHDFRLEFEWYVV